MSTSSPLSYKKEFDIVPKPELRDFDPMEIIKKSRQRNFDEAARLSKQKKEFTDEELLRAFNVKKGSSKTYQDKNDLYELIHRDDNMDKLYYLLKDAKNLTLSETPLHQIFLRMYVTTSKIWNQIKNNGRVYLEPHDKFYLGLAIFTVALGLTAVS